MEYESGAYYMTDNILPSLSHLYYFRTVSSIYKKIANYMIANKLLPYRYSNTFM